MTTVGLLLAAGSGRRFGAPKALVEHAGEPFVIRAVRTLAAGGCSSVVVALGARAEEVRALLPENAAPVEVPDWTEGMGASLRTGLQKVSSLDSGLDATADAALVHLVDLPGVGPDVVARIVAYRGPKAVVRATYGGVPGHPVLFGRRWWSEIATSVGGDRGARDWLAGRDDLTFVECGDIASGNDVDTPADLDR